MEHYGRISTVPSKIPLRNPHRLGHRWPWEYADSDFWDTPGFESKIVSAHIVHIDVYDLDNQTYIGRWTLDPGDFGSDLMLEEALDEMIKATSDDTVLDFIESMPEA